MKRQFNIAVPINREDAETIGCTDETDRTWEESGLAKRLPDARKHLTEVDFGKKPPLCMFMVEADVNDEDMVWLAMRYDVTEFEDRFTSKREPADHQVVLDPDTGAVISMR
jgi:hypothetical protein